MPFQSVPDVIGASIRGEVDGQDVVNTMYFKRASGSGIITGGEVQTLAQNLSAAWDGVILPLLPDAYVMQLVTTRALDVEGGPVSENSDATGNPGGLAGAAMPNNNTLAISFRTGLAGATNRGRNYWPLFLRTEIVNNRVAQVKIDAIIGAYANFIGPGGVLVGWTWCVCSRKPLVLDGPGRGVVVANIVVTDDVIDNQRRRLPNRGS